KVARKLWKHTCLDEGRIEPEATAQGATADRPAEFADPAVNSQTPAYRPLRMINDIVRCDDRFHTDTGTAAPDMLAQVHRATWPLRRKRVRGGLRRRCYETTGSAATAAEIRSALGVLEARAQFDGPQQTVHIRTAEHAGHIYRDLADDHWRAVDIGPDG